MGNADHTHGTGRHYVPGCEACQALNREARARSRGTAESLAKEKMRERRYNRKPERKQYMREWMREYRATSEGHYKQNEAALKSQSARRVALRGRTRDQQDADFMRLHPDGLKECRGCHERLPMEAFARNRSVSSGRAQSCVPCATKRSRRNFARKVERFNVARGVNPSECLYCQKHVGDDREFDHFVPLSRGGPDVLENLVPACITCNRGCGGKRDADPWEWLERSFPERIPFVESIFPR